MTLSELYNILKATLVARFDDGHERSVVSRRAAGHIAGVKPEDVVLRPDMRVEVDKTAIAAVADRINDDEPLEYIFNSAQFLDMEFYTNSNVLVPRPETEELALMVLGDIRARGGAGELSLLDIGTGSGCIPVYLAKNFSGCHYYAVDISDEALHTAQSNAERHGCSISFMKADILNYRNYSDLDLLKLDIIVSNPPYVLESEKKQMRRNVLAYEPETALFVPDNDPLRFYRAISEFAVSHLKGGGRLYFEVNERFGAQTVMLMQEVGFVGVAVQKDLFGKDRFVFGAAPGGV